MTIETLTTNYVTRAEIWLCLTTLLYFLMNGAQIFETLVFVPKWVSSPPQNFKLLLDGNGASLKIFWIVLHSIHEIAFVLTIIFCWKVDPVRNWLLLLFILHIMVRIWTLSFFAPQIIHFQKIAESQQFPKDLISKVTLWRTLNYVRVVIFIIISLGFIPLCIRLFHFRQ